MNTLYSWLLYFILVVAALLLINRWLMTHLQIGGFLLLRDRNAATLFFFVVLFPGILLHEFSHWVTARTLGLRTHSFTIWPRLQQNGRLELGAVEVEHGPPLAMALVGAAPFIFGTVALLWIVGHITAGTDLVRLFSEPAYAEQLWQRTSDIWFWLYLLFAVANAMIPSASDREPIVPVALFTGGIVLVAFLFHVWPSPSLFWQNQLYMALQALVFSFAFALLVDIAVSVFLILVEFSLAYFAGIQVKR